VSIEFLVTSLIVVATPGTGVLYTLAAGLSRGMRASIVAAFGCTLGILPHMAAAILGLAALLHASALAFQILKYLGVLYLLYMAWNTLRQQGGLTVEADSKSTRQVIVSAILINILNPKLSIFFLAFLPQFVDLALPPVPQFVVLGSLCVLFNTAADVAVVLGASAALARWHGGARVRRILQRVSGATMVALGVGLALWRHER